MGLDVAVFFVLTMYQVYRSAVALRLHDNPPSQDDAGIINLPIRFSQTLPSKILQSILMDGTLCYLMYAASFHSTFVDVDLELTLIP